MKDQEKRSTFPAAIQLQEMKTFALAHLVCVASEASHGFPFRHIPENHSVIGRRAG